MSVKRYKVWSDNISDEPDGDYVKFCDYLAVKEENSKLTLIINDLELKLSEYVQFPSENTKTTREIK